MTIYTCLYNDEHFSEQMEKHFSKLSTLYICRVDFDKSVVFIYLPTFDHFSQEYLHFIFCHITFAFVTSRVSNLQNCKESLLFTIICNTT